MAKIHTILFIAQIIQIYVSAAPSDVSKLKKIANVETADSKLDIPVTLDEASKTSNDDKQGLRQKRFYNYYGFGYPPMNPVIYPNYHDLPDQNGFGPQDPFSQIYRQLQDIVGVVRNPGFHQPPPPPPIPFLFPVLYIPQVNCGCTPQNPGAQPTNGTQPTPETRFPEMEDTRQNWGFVKNPNETVPDDGQEEDFTRPISFVPIRPILPPDRTPPPLEHGSSQGDGTTTTTVTPPSNAYPPAASTVPSTPPTACDAAILSCCHQQEATYNCFVAQGCPDLTAYSNPCDTRVVLDVIDKFARFYGRRNTIG